MTCRYPWTQSDNNIEVFGDANFAGCHSTRKSTVGGVAVWSGQFVKAWSKTMGVLALSSGESELAAVVRAATEGMGLQSILNDFCFCGHAAINQIRRNRRQSGWFTGSEWEKSDIWLLETCGSNTMLVQGKFEFPKMSGLENPSDAQTKYLGPEPLLCHTKTCFWGSLSLMMTSRDECRWVVLRRGVDFVGHQANVQNIAMHGQN